MTKPNRVAGVAALIVALALGLYRFWPHIINMMLPAQSRPAAVALPVLTFDAAKLAAVAAALEAELPGVKLKHVDLFAKAGLTSFSGPETCVGCHREIKVKDAKSGKEKQVDLMENVTTSVHYRFFSTAHPNVWGFNGVLADDFPMGKIDRPCPKPGSFAFTAWAETVELKDGRTLSEGCGQCHVGGQYQAPLGELMPGYRTLEAEANAIDCLICHAQAYDMNKKQVVTDADGRKRWDQDRSLAAVLSVTRTTAQTCLRCHQHNMGGDVYVDPTAGSYMQSLQNVGHSRPRVLHPGSKRGTPYSPSWDVHAAQGMNCTECHLTEGHYIPRGTHTTTLMANDLPGVEVACESCHGAAPHESMAQAQALNDHGRRLACQTCHIPSLHPDSTTMRDFSQTEYEEAAGLHIYTDTVKDTEPGKGITYAWWTGDATFLGNPIGDNPNGQRLYRFYRPQHVWPEYQTFDYAAWYDAKMRPIAGLKPSKLYPFKVYNGKQHIDLQNMGPFGGMFVPYNLPVYLAAGKPDAAAQAEVQKPMMAMLYGLMFKVYLMDEFVSYMEMPRWDTAAYDDVRALERVEPRYIPADASMEISHAIRKDGALSCERCHGPRSVLDWKGLGYTDAERATLEAL
ncbi:MAG: nitrite reductase [Deltaproteobacteria bacterium]|nr:nitrite reductase [Deltaproteobacteria bacterium]